MTDGLSNAVALTFIVEFTLVFSSIPACKVNFLSVCKVALFHLLCMIGEGDSEKDMPESS